MQSEFVGYFKLMSRRLASTDPEELHLRNLSFRELVLLAKVPRNLKLTLPLLTAVSLPGSFVIVPLFFLFPRLLPRDLRTEAQTERLESEAILASQLGPLHEISRLLEREETLKALVKRAKSNGYPQMEALLAAAPCLDNKFSLHAMQYNHMVSLCGLNRLIKYKMMEPRPPKICETSSKGFVRWLFYGLFHVRAHLHKRLETHSNLLYHQDVKLSEGELEKLSTEELHLLCLDRGIYPHSVDTSELIRFMHAWILLSTSVPRQNHSFRLHLPLFLSSTLPANSWLIVKYS